MREERQRLRRYLLLLILLVVDFGQPVSTQEIIDRIYRDVGCVDHPCDPYQPILLFSPLPFILSAPCGVGTGIGLFILVLMAILAGLLEQLYANKCGLRSQVYYPDDTPHYYQLASIFWQKCKKALPLLFTSFAVGVVALLLILSGDVEQNPGPPKKQGSDRVDKMLPSVDNSPLGENDLFDALAELMPVVGRWKTIGEGLRLSPGTLEQITMDNRNPRDCMSAVLKHWLRRNYDVELFGEPTWRTVVKVVAHLVAGNDYALALSIAGRHSEQVDKALPTVDDSPLVPLYDPPKIKELVAVMKTVGDWYTLGLRLGMTTQNLDSLKTIQGANQQKTGMFKIWMEELRDQGEEPTWQHILDVLKELEIKNPIQIIAKRYRPHEVRPTPEARVRKLSDVPTMGELQCLKSKDGKTKVKVIETVAAIWARVANLLNIKTSVVQQLECDHRRVADACQEMFKKRLDDDEEFDEPLTWNMVIGVMKDCGLNVTAMELQTLLSEGAIVRAAATPQTSKQTPSRGQEDSCADSTVSEDVSTSEGASVSPRSSSSTLSEGSQKPPFGCGCGKCTFYSYIESGCPNPIPSASSFPCLDFKGLTHEQQQELRGRLRVESRRIMMKFQQLFSTVCGSLRAQSIPVDKLVINLLSWVEFDPVYKGSQKPVIQIFFKELQAAGSIEKVLWLIKDYFSFFNYHVIEHIVSEFGTNQDKAELRNYKEEFNRYSKRRIYECHHDFGPDHVDLVLMLDTMYEQFTLEAVENFRYRLSGILGVSQCVLRLCRVEEGCFRLMPSFVQQEIFPLSSEQERALIAEEVIKEEEGESEPEATVVGSYTSQHEDFSKYGPGEYLDGTDLEKRTQMKQKIISGSSPPEIKRRHNEASTQASLTSQHVNFRGAEVVAETNFVITKAAKSYSWSGYGFKLDVPDDALPDHASEYQVNVKATLSGQFELPQGYKLASAVYWVKAPGIFKKPVTVEIQHCVNTTDPRKLTFVVAKCTQKDLPYKFTPIKEGIFQPSSSYGVISLTRFSGPAVAAKEEVEDCYCGCVYQKQISSDHWRFYFLVMKRIEVCLTTVQQKFMAKGREIHISKMNICFEGSDHSVSLDIPGHGTITDQWKIMPLYHPRITQEEANRLSDKDVLTESAITECVLVVKWIGGEGSRAAGPLFHTIKLKGAKSPEDYFNVVVDPSLEASSSSASSLQVMSPTATATTNVHMPMNVVTRRTSERPTLPELLNFKGKDGKDINIPKQIGTRYFHFGILLLNDETGAETSAIISNYRDNIEQINLEILRMWTGGKGKPLSWGVLIEILEKSELNHLASKVQAGLTS